MKVYVINRDKIGCLSCFSNEIYSRLRDGKCWGDMASVRMLRWLKSKRKFLFRSVALDELGIESCISGYSCGSPWSDHLISREVIEASL